jgi:TonB family protein
MRLSLIAGMLMLVAVPSVLVSYPNAADDADQLCLCQFVAPIYSPIARFSGIEGNVHLRASIDSSGIPTAVEVLPEKVVQNSPVEILDRAAVEAVKKWRFCPPGPKHDLLVTIKFKLHKELKAADQWYPTEVIFESPLTIEITTTIATVPAS